jgi:hypothetical protein
MTNSSYCPTYIFTEFGLMVYVPGVAVPLTPEHFAQWALAEAYKNAAGRPYAHIV